MTDPLDELDAAFQAENSRHVRNAHGNEHQEAEVEQFTDTILVPAFREIEQRLTARGRRVELTQTAVATKLGVFIGERQEFSYEVKPTPGNPPTLLEVTYLQRNRQGVFNTLPMIMTGTRRNLADISRE